MGKLFELISDEALEKESEKFDYSICDVCGEECETYRYKGTQYDEEGNALDNSYDSYAVCADCILAGSVTHICDFEYIERIDDYFAHTGLNAEEKESIRERLIEKYQRTPDIPGFMQGEDRPLCCNDITEFTGHPENDEELYEISEYNYWEKGLKAKPEYYDFRKYGRPESYSDIAAFQCAHCGKRYFTFQFT